MGSEYLTAMEEFDINLHTSCEREWDVEEEILMLDPLFKEMMLGSDDRLRGTHNIWDRSSGKKSADKDHCGAIGCCRIMRI